jgi:PKD repeat protein
LSDSLLAAGCASAILFSEKNLTVFPVANFSSNVSEGSAPLPVQFSDLSENSTE